MLATLLLTIIFVMLLVAGMAIGVIIKNKPIKGSCGGLQNLGIKGKCDICGLDPDAEAAQKLKETRRFESASFYDAS